MKKTIGTTVMVKMWSSARYDQTIDNSTNSTPENTNLDGTNEAQVSNVHWKFTSQIV